MNATFLTLIWVSGLVIGYAIGRFEVYRLMDLRRENRDIAEKNLHWYQDKQMVVAAEKGWIGEGPVLANPNKPGTLYDPDGHPVNFDRLSDLPPRH